MQIDYDGDGKISRNDLLQHMLLYSPEQAHLHVE